MVQALDDFGLGDLAVSRLIDYLRECLVSINPVLKQAAIGTVCAAQTHTKENLRLIFIYLFIYSYFIFIPPLSLSFLNHFSPSFNFFFLFLFTEMPFCKE